VSQGAIVSLGVLMTVAASLTVAVSSTHAQSLSGTVVDSNGQPIPGVTANALMGDAAVTGADGRFELKDPWPTIRFTADGYRPLTRSTDGVRATPTIVLERASTPPIVLPWCPPYLSAPGVGDLRVPTFSGTRPSRGEDIDYQTEAWSAKRTWLVHGWGPMWSGGLPSQQDLDSLSRIEERDVRRPTPDAGDHLAGTIADVRGIHPDGRRYRFVGKMLETFEYRHASPEAAAIFDRMLDAMCVVEPELAASGARPPRKP
jgi:hypothetical protein